MAISPRNTWNRVGRGPPEEKKIVTSAKGQLERYGANKSVVAHHPPLPSAHPPATPQKGTGYLQ